jgi:phosphomannomutase
MSKRRSCGKDSMLEPTTPSIRLPRVSVIDSTCVNPAIVRSYDIRGCVGRGLSLNDAHRLGLSYASVARSQRKRHIAVSRDGRLTSPELERTLIEALVAGGMQVRSLGLGPTPFMYFAVCAGALDGGIMVTGSHNPPDQNGFKLVMGGEPVCGAALQALVAAQPGHASGGGVSEVTAQANDSMQAYVRALGQVGARSPSSLHVIWDCGNGAVGAVIGALTAILPGRHTLLNAAVDGRFPAHHPDPAVAENLRQLQAAVVQQHADVGIAFDGDGDRIGVVDSSGAIVWPDQLLLLLALEALEMHSGVPIVADVKSSRVLFDEVARRGGRAVMVPSGYVRVRAAMLKEGAPLAGEMSGHIFFKDCWHATDDALFVALRMLAALGRLGCTLREYRSSLPPTAATPELRLNCPEHRKAQVIEEVSARLVACDGVRIDTTDGLRVTTEDGWWLLRASGTEPKLTARCEAADSAGLARLQRALMKQLARSGVQCGV